MIETTNSKKKKKKKKEKQQMQTVSKIGETTDHIMSTCPKLAKEQYIKRHERMCCTTL